MDSTCHLFDAYWFEGTEINLKAKVIKEKDKKEFVKRKAQKFYAFPENLERRGNFYIYFY